MPQCAVITCGNNYRKASNVRYHRFPTENYIREHWKAICGRKDPTYNCQTARVCSLHFSRDNYEKDLEHELLGLPPRTRLRRGAYPDVDVPVALPNLKKIMKQISGIKKKLNGKKSGQQNGLEQNALKKSKINKKVLTGPKKPASATLKSGLNVNERPVRKKKKTKKYETYERDRKSPTPEIRQETNLLLALGLTPVKKTEEDLNRMHIMEEENGKVSADAAQLPETPADLPKKTVANAKTCVTEKEIVEEEEASATPKLNGVCEKAMKDEALSEDAESKKNEDDKEDAEITKLPGTPKPADVKEELERRPELAEDKSSEAQDLTVTCTSAFEVTKPSLSERHYPNSKVISISVEQCQTNHNSVNSIPCKDEDGEKVKKPKQITNRKRSTKSTDSDESYKASCKRSKYPDFDHLNEERERTVSEFVDKASGSSLEELQRNAEKLQQEIHSLSALARAKELEWNDIIRLKKVKEEMYLRLIRRKQVMLLSMGASGRVPDASNWDFTSENRMSEFFTNDEVSYHPVTPSVSPKPPPRIPSNLTITKSQSNTSQNLQRFLMQPQGSAETKSNTSLMMVPIVSSTPLSISPSSYMPRAQMATPLKIPVPDRDKLKGSRIAPIPILPKPNQSANEHSPPIGRQGPIVDVKSIIADYRQNHPEQIPRRGRRLKGQPGQSQVQNIPENIVTSSRGVLSMSSLALGSGSQVRTIGSTSGNDVSYLVGGVVQNSQESSRPSSADSNRSTSNAANDLTGNGYSFKDVLVQFAKMSQSQQNDRRNATPPSKAQVSTKSALYPEVTLHPVIPSGSSSPPNPSSSLLHGILTKSNSGRNEGQSNSRNTTFSPTLARLLTTPDRSSMSTTITTAMRGSGTSSTSARGAAGPVSISDLLSTSKAVKRPKEVYLRRIRKYLAFNKEGIQPLRFGTQRETRYALVKPYINHHPNRNELTITPVVSTQQPAKMKEDVGSVSEDDQDDSADRLVIDESEEQENRGEDEDMDNEGVPECQGCHMKSAQFVCAGCGNQWYCSRNCQVTAWDEHSEVCSG